MTYVKHFRSAHLFDHGISHIHNYRTEGDVIKVDPIENVFQHKELAMKKVKSNAKRSVAPETAATRARQRP